MVHDPTDHRDPARPRRRLRGRRRRARATATAALAVVLVVAAGCASSRDASTSSAQVASNQDSSGAVALAGGGAPAAEGASLAPDLVAQVAAPDRPVVSSARLTVETDDVAAAKPRALAIVAAKGGYLFADETSFGSTATATLTLKVPPKELEATISDLGGLGALRSQQVSSEDVTDQVIDLESRITAAEGTLERTRVLLDEAGGLDQIRQLEDEFARRQVDLEKLRGQRATLEKRIDLATVELTLHGADDSTPALAPGEAPPPPGFADGFGGGLAVATTLGTWALAVVGALVPFLPVAAVAVGVVWLARRRRAPHEPVPAEP